MKRSSSVDTSGDFTSVVALDAPVSRAYGGYADIGSLQAAIITPTKDNAVIFIAWEHSYLVKVVQNIMNAYGGGVTVPAWVSGDYDSLYVLHVSYSTGTPVAQFHKAVQGLNGQPTACPF
jgi:hypothetical protein